MIATLSADRGEALNRIYWNLFNDISTLVYTRPTNDENDPTTVYLSLHFYKLIELVSYLELGLYRPRHFSFVNIVKYVEIYYFYKNG